MEPMLKQRVTELHRWRVASPTPATASEATRRGTHTVVKCHTSPSSGAARMSNVTGTFIDMKGPHVMATVFRPRL